MSPKPLVEKRPYVIIVGLIVTVLLALGASSNISSSIFEIDVPALAANLKARSSRPPRVDVVSAIPSPPTRRLVLLGETAAWYDSKIFARATGYVEKWLVDFGDSVIKGQTLALIETPELDAQLAAARAQLSAAQAEVSVRQATADFAKSTYERWRTAPTGLVSEQADQTKKAASIAADFELIASKARVTQHQADVERLVSLTAFKEVKAPFDGTIVLRNIDIGDLVTADDASRMPALFRIVRNEPIRVFVNVPQDAADDLLIGDTVSVSVGDRHHDGALARISRAIDPQSKTLRAEVDLSNSGSRLVPGMDVQVSFTLKNPAGVRIPKTALLFRARPQVAVLDADHSIEIRDVVIGLTDRDLVQIDVGLHAGDKVVLDLDSQITSGMKVDAHEHDARLSTK